jgi:hypothetical protein
MRTVQPVAQLYRLRFRGSSTSRPICYAWFQASAAMYMRSVLFCDITQRWVAILYWRFETTYRSHLQGSRCPGQGLQLRRWPCLGKTLVQLFCYFTLRWHRDISLSDTLLHSDHLTWLQAAQHSPPCKSAMSRGPFPFNVLQLIARFCSAYFDKTTEMFSFSSDASQVGNTLFFVGRSFVCWASRHEKSNDSCQIKDCPNNNTHLGPYFFV